MDLADIQTSLTQLLVGKNVSHMKVAGVELEIFFSGTRLSTSGFASIDTDAWVFVGDGKKFDPSKITEDDFFSCREAALVGIYRLTGYDVESVTLEPSGIFGLRIGGVDVLIYPIATDSPYVQDS